MGRETTQLRGWKEIAGYLRASERTVRRWEAERGLPVHRIAGAARDVVFALPEELDAWASHTPECASEAAEADHTPVAPATRQPRTLVPSTRRARGRVLAALVMIAALVAAGRFGVFRRGLPSTPPAAASPVDRSPSTAATQASSRRGVVLQITGRDGVPARLTVPDGQCGAIAISGHPFLEMCPRFLGDGLLVDIVDRATQEGGENPRTTLRLDAASAVRVARPVQLDIEWLQPPDTPTTRRSP